MAEDALYGELAFVMGKNKAEMEPFMIQYMENKGKKKEMAGALL